MARGEAAEEAAEGCLAEEAAEGCLAEGGLDETGLFEATEGLALRILLLAEEVGLNGTPLTTEVVVAAV